MLPRDYPKTTQSDYPKSTQPDYPKFGYHYKSNNNNSNNNNSKGFKKLKDLKMNDYLYNNKPLQKSYNNNYTPLKNLK